MMPSPDKPARGPARGLVPADGDLGYGLVPMVTLRFCSDLPMAAISGGTM
jgi:hypothetical protein